MSAIIPFDSAKLPVRGVEKRSISSDVIRAAEYPYLSIKGKQFTIVRDGVKTVVTKPDDPEEVAQNIQAVILRANTSTRTFYAKSYSEGESDGTKPTCYTNDGVAPAPDAEDKQAKKCALCPHAVWGSGKEGKGSACKSSIRLAVATPDKLDEPYLLRVPPASFSDKEKLNGFKDLVKIAKQRGLEYNEVVVRIGFDKDAPSPKLTFKPIGVLPDNQYVVALGMYDAELVESIVGVGEHAAAAPAKKDTQTDEIANELDAALEARKAAKKAAESAKHVEDDDEPAPPKAKKVAKPVEDDEDEAPKAKPKKAKPVDDDEASDADLLASLNNLLGSTDD